MGTNVAILYNQAKPVARLSSLAESSTARSSSIKLDVSDEEGFLAVFARTVSVLGCLEGHACGSGHCQRQAIRRADLGKNRADPEDHRKQPTPSIYATGTDILVTGGVYLPWATS